MNPRFAPHNRTRGVIGRQIRADWFAAVRSTIDRYREYIGTEADPATESENLAAFQAACSAVHLAEHLAAVWEHELPKGFFSESQRTAYRRVFGGAGVDCPMTFRSAIHELSIAFPASTKGTTS